MLKTKIDVGKEDKILDTCIPLDKLELNIKYNYFVFLTESLRGHYILMESTATILNLDGPYIKMRCNNCSIVNKLADYKIWWGLKYGN